MGDYSEDRLIEQPTIALFRELGWETVNCYQEIFGIGGTLGRQDSSEVVLRPRLWQALERLNSGIPPSAIGQAVEALARDRSTMGTVQANQDVYQLLKDGIVVTYPDRDCRLVTQRLRVIDWDQPENNAFLLASQFWVTGEMYKRRADLVGFVNGLPWVFVELKGAHKRIEDAFQHNLRDYRQTVPQLFWYNALVILSNGSEARVGSTSAAWEHFAEWKKVEDERERGRISLETLLRGTCQPRHLLDLAENFTLFSEGNGALMKMLAMNHQYLGVNRSIQAVRQIRENQGKLGVFWHTQGSGKSYSMVFFAQKILRKLAGNWTFVIVTDRQELDDQIYKNFQGAGAVSEKHVQATSGEDLKQLLQEDHRYVFTLIQKFHTEAGERFPTLSQRSDIIVITDEAHRSQYDLFALNMRNALPNAAFIGFTGTPLMAGEEKTREVFGDYVSIYDFKQSVDDHATVPLFYENRIPELELLDPDFNRKMEELLDQADLSEIEEQRLEREFAREYHLITRPDRLEKIASDIVGHFMGRGWLGKAMVVSIDKATAVRMYDLVKAAWPQGIADLRRQQRLALSTAERESLEKRIRYLEETDMAVVVSQGQNEVEDLSRKGVDIRPHRKRIVSEDLETKFKKADDPLRLVFVCAMWMTGFDVPSCSTIYLDKPMRNHTLMQTIARANRVFGEKVNGLIVDYIGIFRDLQKALAIYGSGQGGALGGGEMPIQPKEALVEELRKTLVSTEEFLASVGVSLESGRSMEGFDAVAFQGEAVEAVLVSEKSKRKFLSLANEVGRLFSAILPDRRANEFSRSAGLVRLIAEGIRQLEPEVDVSQVMEKVWELMDGFLRVLDPPEGYGKHVVDLGQVDFEALRRKLEKGRKRTEIERLTGQIGQKLTEMIRKCQRRPKMSHFRRLNLSHFRRLNLSHFRQSNLSHSSDLN
jgi:type I restriction enzyme R subunit